MYVKNTAHITKMPMSKGHSVYSRITTLGRHKNKTMPFMFMTNNEAIYEHK